MKAFFIQHEPTIYRQHACIECSYYQLLYANKAWHTQKIFDFNLPSHLLFAQHDSCLHESLLPLIPRVSGNYVFFCTHEQAADFRRKSISLDVYAFNRATGTQVKLSNAGVGQFFFAPLLAGNRLFYGGTLAEDSSVVAPIMWMNEYGQTCFELPYSDIAF